MGMSCCTWRMSGGVNEFPAGVIDLHVALGGLSSRKTSTLGSMDSVMSGWRRLSFRSYANRSHCSRTDGIDDVITGW